MKRLMAEIVFILFLALIFCSRLFGQSIGAPSVCAVTPAPGAACPKWIPLKITLTVGSVTTLPPGSAASAVITGNSPNFILSLGIPQGQSGAPGPNIPGLVSDGLMGIKVQGNVMAGGAVEPGNGTCSVSCAKPPAGAVK